MIETVRTKTSLLSILLQKYGCMAALSTISKLIFTFRPTIIYNAKQTVNVIGKDRSKIKSNQFYIGIIYDGHVFPWIIDRILTI